MRTNVQKKIKINYLTFVETLGWALSKKWSVYFFLHLVFWTLQILLLPQETAKNGPNIKLGI